MSRKEVILDFTYFGTISLGGLINLLKQREADQLIKFDFCGFVPSGIRSYRGYYDHLALSFDVESSRNRSPVELTVATLLELLESSNGSTYTGYKGGQYTMGLQTPVWVDNYACATGTGIVGLSHCNDMTVISTAFIE
jgi:hypothetical protein